jgi:hypothetical protein
MWSPIKRNLFTFNVHAIDAESHRIVLKGSSRSIPLGYITRDVKARARRAQKKHIRHVLIPPHSSVANDTDVYTNLLVQHIAHHGQLGIYGTTAYCRADTCTRFSTLPALKRLIESRQLTFVPWDFILPVQNWPLYDQQAQENHAILRYFGTDNFLMFADLDEFLITKHRRNVINADGLDLAPGCVELSRFNVYSSHNISLQTGNPIAGIDLWSGSAHPLPKHIIDPDKMTYLYVHKGEFCSMWKSTQCTQSTRCIGVDNSCMRIAHHTDMIKRRPP